MHATRRDAALEERGRVAVFFRFFNLRTPANYLRFSNLRTSAIFFRF